ncbi:glycerophosphodiester phosphodiesterase [Pseudothauera rhizosphaerae]|uniref:Glycerophosphodiester phosphodiesterase n=1 Tax=Pseudothauera rhizosphaerae TaxID=2565932 RepID=A0A4S4ALY3_9RHOO|nr:glycerophosphodiester phosphodiesterase [Pseudothauera rhizosphaerae]THF60465.1 glycerophosphodiester phosphodiesterase [Pseudothauera rhizosphaerae]
MGGAAPWRWPRVLAHRCGGGLAPENTLAGLEAARACGCRGVEFDAMLSADGVPVLIHDETLERTTNGSGAVAETPFAVLRRLDAGRWFDERFAGERIPALGEAAARCLALGLAVNLEIKPAAGHEAQTGRVVAELARALWRGQSLPPLSSSFSEEALAAAAVTAPELPRGLLVETVPADFRERCVCLGAIALHVGAEGLDAATVAAVRGAGLHVLVYTVNDAQQAAALFDWGVDCIVTDHPERIKEPAAAG